MTHCIRATAIAVLVGILAMIAPAILPAQTTDSPTHAEFVGHWQGTLVVGDTRLRLVFHLQESDDGTLEATMDSPDQGATGIPVERVTVEGDSITLDITAIGAVYAGELTADRVAIEGEWRQGGMAIPLKIERVEEVTELRRPQEPVPPYPYREEEVTLDVPGTGVTLAGTLTLPPGGGPHPAVVLVSGSGAQDRDETLFGHRPFLVIADHLARRGVAALRLDDRGVGGSTGSTVRSTLADRAEDVLAAVRFLRRRLEVDRERIGLVGHSEGGWVAPLAALEGPDEVAFLVFLAGPAQNPRDLLGTQRRALLAAEGADEATITALLTLQERAFDVLDETPDAAAAQPRLEGLREAVAAELPTEQRQALETYFAGQPEAVRTATIRTANTAWFRDLLSFNAGAALRRIRQPVLALFGGNDLQVPAAENAAALRRLLGGDRGDAAVRVLPGLNHLFQPSLTGLPAEYASIETTIAPEVLELIGDWIAETVEARPRR